MSAIQRLNISCRSTPNFQFRTSRVVVPQRVSDLKGQSCIELLTYVAPQTISRRVGHQCFWAASHRFGAPATLRSAALPASVGRVCAITITELDSLCFLQFLFLFFLLSAFKIVAGRLKSGHKAGRGSHPSGARGRGGWRTTSASQSSRPWLS